MKKLIVFLILATAALAFAGPPSYPPGPWNTNSDGAATFDGNVGLGKDSPLAPLYIGQSSDTSYAGLAIESVNNGNTMRLWLNGSYRNFNAGSTTTLSYTTTTVFFPRGNVHISSTDTHGGYVTKIYEASVDIAAAATATLDLNIPSGWVVKGCQLHVKTALAAGETWDAELNDGGTEESIVSAAAVAQNTNVNHFGHADAGYGGTLTDAETDIVISKNGGGAFTAQGTIEGHCMAFGFDGWDNE